jgi:7-carboxy-7-deazaguanine synthase
MASAYLSEIFTSVQGEGPDVGVPALFVRFGGCNLECSYCDTPASRSRSAVFRMHGKKGSRTIDNPIESSDLVAIIMQESDGPRLAVLTGGEPLLQPEAVSALGRGLKARGFRIHLETNGTLPEAVRDVMEAVDLVVMDLKLPASQAGRDLWKVHKLFLGGIEHGKVAAKVVVPYEAPDEEVMKAVRLVANVNPAIPVFLQPAFVGSRPQVEGERILGLLSCASDVVENVRVSVQMHKVLGIR